MHRDRCNAQTGRSRFWSFLVVVGVGLAAGSVGAQQQTPPGLPSPRLLVVIPSGGRAGTTVEVTLTGQDLDNPQGLLFSHSGIRAERIEEARPEPGAPA